MGEVSANTNIHVRVSVAHQLVRTSASLPALPPRVGNMCFVCDLGPSHQLPPLAVGTACPRCAPPRGGPPPTRAPLMTQPAPTFRAVCSPPWPLNLVGRLVLSCMCAPGPACGPPAPPRWSHRPAFPRRGTKARAFDPTLGYLGEGPGFFLGAVSANINSYGSIWQLLELRAPAFAYLIQEHKLKGPSLDRWAAQLRARGLSTHACDAYVTPKQGLGGGVAILAHSDVGLAPYALPPGLQGRAAAAIIRIPNYPPFILVSLYLLSGEGVGPKNTQSLELLGHALREAPLPFVVGGDWQAPPRAMERHRGDTTIRRGPHLPEPPHF